MLCELRALLPRVLGPKPKSTAGLGHTGDGVCTMDPDIGRWVCQCFGKDIDSKNTKVTLKLDDLAGMFWTRKFLEEEPKGPRHTAGRDADLHRAAYIALQRLCRLCV